MTKVKWVDAEDIINKSKSKAKAAEAIDDGIKFLRLCLSPIFSKYPDLKISWIQAEQYNDEGYDFRSTLFSPALSWHCLKEKNAIRKEVRQIMEKIECRVPGFFDSVFGRMVEIEIGDKTAEVVESDGLYD